MNAWAGAAAGMVFGAGLAGLFLVVGGDPSHHPLYLGGGAGAIAGAVVGAARDIVRVIDRHPRARDGGPGRAGEWPEEP